MIGREDRMTKEMFSKSRYNNFWSKSIIVIFVLLTTLGIYWKKKRILLKIPKSQKNVLTLKQTVAVIFLAEWSTSMSRSGSRNCSASSLMP